MKQPTRDCPLANKNLRLQFSGFAVFASKLVSVVTGFAFQFMLARAISGSAQYNIWFNIADVVTYFTLLGGVVPFWVMRYVARGREGAVKTGLVTNLIISGLFAAAYLATAPFILAGLNISADYLLLYSIAAIQIIELCSLNVLESCLQAIKPQTVGYGLVIQQLIKLGLGYVLIVLIGFPLFGAVVCVLASFGFQMVYYYKLIWRELKEKIQWGYVKDWLKGSTATVYNVVGNQLTAFVLILLYNFGSSANPDLTGARGYYGAAAQIAQIVAYSSFLAYAMYPKLLADRDHRDITTSVKMVLMFAIPMTVGAVALADSYMGLLSPNLRVAANVLVILSVDAFATVVSGLYSSVLFGIENVDEAGFSLGKLVRSRLFLIFSLPFLQAAIALPLTYYLLTIYALHLPVVAALCVSIVYLLVHAISLTFLVAIVRKMIKVEIPWRSVLKYSFAAAVMGAVMYFLPHPERISTTLVETVGGASIYLGVLLALDGETRALAKSVIGEFKNRTIG